MVWRKITVNTTEDAEEILASEIADLGIEGTELCDRAALSESDKKEMFVDILPDTEDDDGSAEVSFYCEIVSESEKEKRLLELKKLSEDPSADMSYMPNSSNIYTEEELSDLISRLKDVILEMRNYCDIGEGTIDISDTEDKDWRNNWKTFFHPFKIDDILIKPVWEEIPDEDYGLLIEIDPGNAFGTGMHETTRLCMRQIRKYLKKGDSFLDIGTGSGILGITALKLGAKSCLGTDLDEAAVHSVSDNLRANSLSEDMFRVWIGNVIGLEDMPEGLNKKYDMAAANILAPVIVLLAGEVGRFLKPGGIFITSGIVKEKRDMVMEAFLKRKDEWEILEETREGDWVNITVRKR